MRLEYREAANEQISPSTEVASDRSIRAAHKGAAHAGSKQSTKGRKGSDTSAEKDSTWQQCLQHAQAAAQAWQGYLHAAEGVHGFKGLTDEDTLPQLMLELLYMAGLHGKPCWYAFGFTVPALVPSLLLYLDPSPVCFSFTVWPHAWPLPWRLFSCR